MSIATCLAETIDISYGVSNMKTIKTNYFIKISSLIEDIEAETLASAIETEMEDVDNRTIAKQRAIANRTKEHNYYKKKKEEKTGN